MVLGRKIGPGGCSTGLIPRWSKFLSKFSAVVGRGFIRISTIFKLTGTVLISEPVTVFGSKSVEVPLSVEAGVVFEVVFLRWVGPVVVVEEVVVRHVGRL